MRGFILATAITLSASMASAEAHIQPAPPTASQMPVDAGICTAAAGGVAAVVTGTGVGALPAAVLVTVCAIAANDLKWHLNGGKHVDSKNECRPIPDSNAQQGNCG